MSVEEGVGLLGGGGEVPGVWVQVAAGGLDGFVPDDVLRHVRGDACVGPSRSRRCAGARIE